MACYSCQSEEGSWDSLCPACRRMRAGEYGAPPNVADGDPEEHAIGQRAALERIGAAFLWAIPISIITLIAELVIIGVMSRLSGLVIDIQQLLTATPWATPAAIIAGLGLTAVLSLVGILPGTSPEKILATPHTDEREPLPPSAMILCGWPFVLALFGGAIGGALGGAAAATSLSVYRKTDSLFLGFLCSVVSGASALAGWYFIVLQLVQHRS